MRDAWPSPLLECLLALGVTLPLVVLLRLPTLWFVVPFAILTLRNRPYEEFGLSLAEPGSPLFHLTVTVTVLGGYAVAHWAFARYALGREFHPTLAPEPGRLLFDQLVVIGLSEEFFFRGYVQTMLGRSMGRPYRFLGASWGNGLVISAVLFGVCHLVGGDLTRLRVIAFGLFAGWLRERTGTILVPAAYHGLSNVLYDFMQRSMR